MPIPRRTRIINSSRVIRELWVNGAMSRAAIAKSLDMNKSSMTQIVEELMKYHVLEEGSIIQSGPKGGRKATELKLNKDWFYIMGIELRSDSYTALAIDIEGTILYSKTVPQGFSAPHLVKDLDKLVEHLIEETAFLNRPLMGVGIGFSGIIDTEKQIIIKSISLEFDKPFDFGKSIRGKYNFPILLENDANCGAWGEVVQHRRKQLKNFLFILVEFWKHYHDDLGRPRPTIGIGMGFNGKIYHGSQWASGEFRSMFNTDVNNHEQIALPSPDSTWDITEDQAALRSYIEELCSHVAFLANVLDIGTIFIGGDTEQFESFIVDLLHQKIESNSMNKNDMHHHTINMSSLGYHAVSYGAAALVLDTVFMNLEPLDHFEKSRLKPLFFMDET